MSEVPLYQQPLQPYQIDQSLAEILGRLRLSKGSNYRNQAFVEWDSQPQIGFTKPAKSASLGSGSDFQTPNSRILRVWQNRFKAESPVQQTSCL